MPYRLLSIAPPLCDGVLSNFEAREHHLAFTFEFKPQFAHPFGAFEPSATLLPPLAFRDKYVGKFLLARKHGNLPLSALDFTSKMC